MRAMSREKQTILFVGEDFTSSHLMRPWVLAQAASRLVPDIEVHFAAPRHPEPDVPDAHGIRVHSLPGPGGRVISRRIERVFIPPYSASEVGEMVAAEIELINRVKPRFVVHDFRNSLAISTQRAGVPLITLTDFCWSEHYVPENVVPDNPLTALIGERLSGRIAGFLTPRVEALYARPFNRVARRHGLAPFDSLRSLYSFGRENWFMDIPSIVPFSLAPQDQCIGPVFWETKGETPDWLRALPDRSAICITFAGSGDARHLGTVIEALQPFRTPLIVLTAGRVSIERQHGVFSADFLPLSAVMAKSNLLICHGGSSLVYHAIRAGIPAIGVPSNVAQWYSMIEFERAGCGALIQPSMLTRENLVRTVERLRSGTIDTEGLQKAADEIRAHHAGERAAHGIRRLLAR